MKRIFLLGGHDLEMQEIRNLLTLQGERFVDKNLNWRNSNLSAYAEIIATEPDSDFYGIELHEDYPLPKHYTRIDHHNDYNNRPASILQVAEIIGVTPDRHMLLVAANDAGYIPAMKALEATDEEIDDIRQKDRKAQGVSEEEEQQAKKAVETANMSYPGLVIVKEHNDKFSPVVDRLSNTYPYHSYVVYNETSICTYGSIASSFRDYYHDSKKLYYGGIGNGYAGLSHVDESIDQIIEQIKHMKPISKHIFLFPFEYTKRAELDKTLWKKVSKPENEQDKVNLFNEKQYFYPFVHKALYDDASDNTLLRHYERVIKGEKYIIQVGERTYTLDIESINVNLYDFGIGILSVHLQNTDIGQSAPEDILKINQYGRRVMPPFFKDISNNPRVELADRIAIVQGKECLVEEDFSKFGTEDTWCVGKIISYLLHPLENIEPIIDDRMFTLCYYENSEEMARIAKTSPYSESFCRNCLNDGASCKDFWYKYVFVDGGESATCYGDKMYHKLLSEHTYTRWEHPEWGTEYGVSKYSLVALTTETAPSFLLDYFETIYTRLAELILCQRAGLVFFSEIIRDLACILSKPVGEITENDIKKSTELSNAYIKFVNDFCYREVTAQDQGVELYSLMKSTLNTDSFESTLREQILQLHNRILDIYNQKSQDSNEKRERYSFMLNKLAGAIIPITILASLVGLWQLWEEEFEWYWVLVFTIGVIAGGIIGGNLLLLLINRIK